MRVGELLRRLEQDGWVVVRQRGSHRVYRHPTKRGQLVVPVHAGKELATGTLHSLLKRAGLDHD
jgi:predicted RNA binding protein YcfA (HicA-like mRNA interferase family)